MALTKLYQVVVQEVGDPSIHIWATRRSEQACESFINSLETDDLVKNYYLSIKVVWTNMSFDQIDLLILK